MGLTPFRPPTVALVAARRRVAEACDRLAAAEAAFRVDKSRRVQRERDHAIRVLAAAQANRAVLHSDPGESQYDPLPARVPATG